MQDPARADMIDPTAAVHLHLHRGWGWGLYGTLTVAVLVIAVLTTARYLTAGDLLLACVAAFGGLLVAGFLGIVTYTVVWPELTTNATGVRARDCWVRTFSARWGEITIDVDDDEAEAGTLRLELGQASVSINRRSWIGFDQFVVMVATSADVTARLTPGARRAVLRMLGTTG